jgi:replication-associated recombination protein RarA
MSLYDFTPQTLDEFVFGDYCDRDLLNDILSREMEFPANGRNTILLYGGYGTGKTTFAYVFLKEFDKCFETDGNWEYDEPLIEKISCDGNAKITSVVERLERISSNSSFNKSGKHYFVFDEIDNWKVEQQQRMKAWMNIKDVVCVMTTNFLHKIDEGLQSRCHVINMNASPNLADYVDRMKQIIDEHHPFMTRLSDDLLMNIASQAKGDWRDICSLLQRANGKASYNRTPPPSAPKLSLVK